MITRADQRICKSLSHARSDPEKIVARHRHYWMRETLRWAQATARAWAAPVEVIEAIGTATPEEIVRALDVTIDEEPEGATEA